MKCYSKTPLRLLLINENDLGKFNKKGDTYILYKTMMSNDINIGFYDNYLSTYSPTLSNTQYLDFATGKAYFYDIDSSYKDYEYSNNDVLYEVHLTPFNTIADSTILKGNTSLEDSIDNFASAKKPTQKLKV